MKPFTSVQKEYIQRGDMLTEMLTAKVVQALGKSGHVHTSSRHHYIASGPGIGKTHTVQKVSDRYKVTPIKIQGVASMNAFAITLAYAAYAFPDTELRVWVDDCDSLFSDKTSLAVMKGVLDEDRNILAWNKNLTNQILTFESSDDVSDNEKGAALRKFQPLGGVGVEVPTDNMHFIVTSNRFLTAPNSNLNTQRKMDEAAIRDRVVYTEYQLDKNDSWGWTASVLLNNKMLGLTKPQKQILLDWMFSNWDELPATSLRAVKGLAADMLNYPESYPDHWEMKLRSM